MRVQFKNHRYNPHTRKYTVVKKFTINGEKQDVGDEIIFEGHPEIVLMNYVSPIPHHIFVSLTNKGFIKEKVNG